MRRAGGQFCLRFHRRIRPPGLLSLTLIDRSDISEGGRGRTLLSAFSPRSVSGWKLFFLSARTRSKLLLKAWHDQKNVHCFVLCLLWYFTCKWCAAWAHHNKLLILHTLARADHFERTIAFHICNEFHQDKTKQSISSTFQIVPLCADSALIDLSRISRFGNHHLTVVL